MNFSRDRILHLSSNMQVQTAHTCIYKTEGILNFSGLYINAHGLWLTQSSECTNCEVNVMTAHTYTSMSGTVPNCSKHYFIDSWFIILKVKNQRWTRGK